MAVGLLVATVEAMAVLVVLPGHPLETATTDRITLIPAVRVGVGLVIQTVAVVLEVQQTVAEAVELGAQHLVLTQQLLRVEYLETSTEHFLIPF